MANEQRINIKDIKWHWNETGGAHKTNLDNITGLLDQVGPGFCLAKFTQVTMHLGQGTVHSCHHPGVHKIPLEELEDNPAALFNSGYLQARREEMRTGEKPEECGYCWRIEDNGHNSDRHYKSMTPWAITNYETAVNSTPTTVHYPRYLEVDFSNVCNFECIYCGPEFSSKWVEQINRHGAIKMLVDTTHEQWGQGWQEDYATMHFKKTDPNPYVEAFWRWWPDLVGQLKVYRITGGEPLMSKETFKSMDYFISNPHPELEFNINSNLCAPPKLWDEFVAKATLVKANVKEFMVYTSVDAWGPQAEYIRPGLDFELFKERYVQLLDLGIPVSTMCTFNILSVTTIKSYFEWMLLLKRKYNYNLQYEQLENRYGFLWDGDKRYTQRGYGPRGQPNKAGIDIPYLRHPVQLDALNTITHQMVQDYLIPALKFMIENTSPTVTLNNGASISTFTGFEVQEVNKFKRIVEDILGGIDRRNPDTVRLNRAKLHDYLQEVDRRHDTDYKTTFPELEHLWRECQRARDGYYQENGHAG